MKFSHRLLARSATVAAAVAVCGLAQAQSSVTLYGIISQDLSYVSRTPSGAHYRLENGRLNASRIGFKGSEDLGGGLSAIFDIESGINPDTGTANGGGTFWNRGSWVGLKGSFGSVTVGRQWNVNDDLLGNFFIFGGYAVFSYVAFDMTSDLLNNSVKYVSPNFGGFAFEALGALGEGGPRTLEVAGSYSGGPIKAALTYHEMENRTTGRKDKLTSAGVSYAVGAFKGRLAYSNAINNLTGTGLAGFPKASAFDIGADFAVDSRTGLSLDYVSQDVKNTSSDSYFIRLLGTYNFSKRTQLNVNVVSLKNKGVARESFFGINGPGRTQHVYSVGLSHFF